MIKIKSLFRGFEIYAGMTFKYSFDFVILTKIYFLKNLVNYDWFDRQL